MNKWQYIVSAILILLLLSEIVWYSPFYNVRKGSFNVLSVVQQSNEVWTNVTITYRFNAGLPLDATVMVTPVREAYQDLPVFVFYDRDYPVLETDWSLIAMLQGYLKAELSLRGYSAEPKLASADVLESIMSKNESAVVIMASGAFPSCIFSKEKDLVRPWIESGGILVWLGYYIGYYVVESGMQKEQITYNMSQNLRENGSRELGLEGFFEYFALDDNPKVATSSSPLSEALDTTYALIQQAPLLRMVMSRDGVALGSVGGENPLRFRSSISMIPVGRGKIMIFGFFLMPSLSWNGPQLVAWDIAQIMCSGVLQMNPDLVPWYRTYNLSEEKAMTDISNLSMGSDVAGFVVFEYTPKESETVLFHREFINRK